MVLKIETLVTSSKAARNSFALQGSFSLQNPNAIDLKEEEASSSKTVVVTR